MRRGVMTLAFVAAFGGAALAQDAAEARLSEEADPIGGEVSNHEIGARIGMQLGQGITPGGLRFAGVYLHRMNDVTWSEFEAGFAFGSGEASCWLDRSRMTQCDPGVTSGVAASLGAGVRWFTTRSPSGLVPYLRGGIALHYADFRGDAVNAWAIPAYLGGGGRLRVGGGAAVNAELLILAGPGFYSDGMGTNAYGGMIVQVGVDLDL